jgi:hypothetical protein
MYAYPNFSLNVGTVANYFGLYLDSGSGNGAGGTITNSINLYVVTPRSGTGYTYNSFFQGSANAIIINSYGNLSMTYTGVDQASNYIGFWLGGLFTAGGGDLWGLNVQCNFGATSTNTVGSAAGIYIAPSFASNSGTITTAYGLQIASGAGNGAGGAITHSYSLYVANPVYGSSTYYNSYFHGDNNSIIINNYGNMTIGAGGDQAGPSYSFYNAGIACFEGDMRWMATGAKICSYNGGGGGGGRGGIQMEMTYGNLNFVGGSSSNSCLSIRNKHGFHRQFRRNLVCRLCNRGVRKFVFKCRNGRRK